MSKAHRGKGIRGEAAHGRGECPVCKRSSVKILYEQEAGETKLKICKTCKAALKHGKKDISHLAAAAPAAEAAPVAE
jgi:CRISPR/Cas system-associated protein Cas10 (large subunit of type III CRISPR-Cas system)